MFDDRNTFWFRFPGFEGLDLAVNRLDPEQGLADFLVRFEPNSVIPLHRHLAETGIFVMQGEHRIYEPDGTLKDVRPVGSYTLTPASAPPHREGAGDEACIIHYFLRSEQDLIFEFLNDDLSLLTPLTISAVVARWEQAKQEAAVPA